MFFTEVSYYSSTGKIIFSRRNPYESFQSSDVCELCVVVCRDFEKFKSFRMWELFTVLRVWNLGIHLVCGDFEISQSSLVCKFCVLWWAKCLKCFSCGYIHKFTWKPYSDLSVFWKRQTKKKRWLMTTFNKPVPNFLFECIKLELLL